MERKGYTLMYSVVHGNVLGAVIAPRGTESWPKDRRPFIWRAMIRPLVEEVAEHEEFPTEDVRKVSADLFAYCRREGIAIAMDGEDKQEE